MPAIIIEIFNPSKLDRSPCFRVLPWKDHKNGQIQLHSILCGLYLRFVTAGAPARYRIVIENTIFGEIVWVMAAGVKDRYRNSIRLSRRQGRAGFVNPNALCSTVDPEFAKTSRFYICPTIRSNNGEQF